MQTQTIFIRDGFWNSCYEPYDLPGAYCRTRYAITPTDGSSLPSNGEYKGFVLVDNLLRLVSGGEYFGGSMMNQLCRDFTIVFDEAFHDEYRAGIERGYKGKRGVHWNYFCKCSEAWRDGYLEGREARERLAS
jgi:hypothetical protein